MPRVLVIEDDPTVSLLISDALCGYGFEVDMAQNGAVAMATLDKSSPSVILLDLMMPVMDGWEFMRQCRVMPRGSARPTLVLSAVPPDPSALPVPMLVGKYEFLAKPFDLDELMEAVTRLAAS
jgi:CheY-like chemotaxis protein